MNKTLITLAAATALVGAAVLWTQAESSPQDRAPIDTDVLEDGTKEHVLINDGQDLTPGTDDDQYWVLRVPADVYSASFEDVIRERQGREPHSAFAFNRDLTILQPYAVDPSSNGLTDHNSSKIVAIGLSSEYRDYEVLGWSARSSFATLFENTVGTYCAVDGEVSSGVFQLRDLTADELQQEVEEGSIKQSIENVYHGCRAVSGNRNGFIVVVDGEKVGWMSCFKPEDEHLAQNCSFSAWMHPNLIVRMTFPNADQERAPQMYRFVQETIREFTNLERSQNISFQ